MDQNSGLLQPARYVPSPNYDQRPDDTPPSLVVIHNISLPPGKFGGPEIEAFFCNQLNHDEHPFFEEIRGLTVSSHLLIRRDGEVLQFVPFTQRAWHAGVSCYEGRECCNDFSIGIELEGTDDKAYEAAQYTMLSNVIQALIQAYPDLDPMRIVGHSDIAPGRKTDPGPAFDWQKLARLLQQRNLNN